MTLVGSRLPPARLAFICSKSKTEYAVAGSFLGIVKAFSFRSLRVCRPFCLACSSFCFGVSRRFLALVGFLRALVDLALVLGLDFFFGLVLGFLAADFLAAGFFVGGFLVVAAASEVVAWAVSAFLRGALVVRPVCAFGRETALVAYGL